MTQSTTLGGYLLSRLREVGIRHVFGLPGDYNLAFLDRLAHDPGMEWVGTCNELNAAYAADGYARVRGVGAILTTFGVGELSAINGVAGSFAEHVPVVAITGAPSLASQRSGGLLHHTLGTSDFSVFSRMYEPVTVGQAQLGGEDDPGEIDRVLSACLTERRPVSLTLPSDVVDRPVDEAPARLRVTDGTSDPAALAEAADAVVALLEAAERPVVLSGIGIDRSGLRAELRRLLEATGYPFATLAMAKGLLEESHPQFLGLYDGALSDEGVRRRIEEADGVLAIGTLMTDFNTGEFSARLDPERLIDVQSHLTRVRHALFPRVAMRDLLHAVTPRLRRRVGATRGAPARLAGVGGGGNGHFEPRPSAPITQARFWPRMAGFLREDDLVVAEAGTAIFGIIGLPLPKGVTFLSQLLWASIGYSVGALLGASLAAPERRALLFVGDGAFQLTGQELSTMLRRRLTPIIFVLNNSGYTTERVIHGPTEAYHAIPPWQYHRLPEVLGTGGWGIRVRTEGELEAALATAEGERGRLSLVEVVLDPMDAPEALRAFGKAAAQMMGRQRGASN
jgi:TPP-dependent 2-oxoacid decarboxylase